LDDVGLQIQLEKQLDSLKSKMSHFVMADSMQKVPEVQSKVGGHEGEFRSLENSEKIN